MLNKFLQRKDQLKKMQGSLNRFAPLDTMSGRKYLSCLALLVFTEMQIEEQKEEATTSMAAK